MEKNVGKLDRFFRLGIGFLSLAVAVAAEDTALRVVFGLVALIGLGTAITGRCPIIARLGLKTTPKNIK